MIAHCRLPRTLPCGRPADRALSPSLTAGCQHPGQLPRLALWQERGCAPRATRENDHLRALGKLSDSHARFAAENQAKSWIPVLKSDRTSEHVYEVPCNLGVERFDGNLLRCFEPERATDIRLLALVDVTNGT